jgi:hypothetical protein
MVLLLLGGVFILTGWVQLDTAGVIKNYPAARRSYAAHLDVMPMQSWGWVFIVVGVAAGFGGVAGRVPAWLGFALLQALSLFWGLLFVASYYQTGYGRCWIGLLQWAMVAGLLAIIADWEDPPVRDATEVVRLLREEER